MSLARKFIIILIFSILFIAIVNILAFYIFYTSYLKVYLAEKLKLRNELTIEYINDVIEKQAIDDIDSIFEDTEISFFELLENSEGKIPLNKEENVDIVVNYLVKSGVAPKYIEEIIPTNNFSKVLESLKDTNSPEHRFINKLSVSIIITNIISIIFLIFVVLLFTRKIIFPIKDVTKKIKNFKEFKNYEELHYHNKKDEIGLLIESINSLNKKIKLQEKIKNRLLADISHELKTPITSIQCYLEGINDGIIKLNEKNLKSITEEMKRLIILVNKIMEYEDFESKKLKLELSKKNVSNIIKDIVETHKKKLKENKQMVKVVGDDSLELELDKDLFKQLIHNLIGNFLKYSGKRTLLTINITRKYIDFSDNGRGIKSSEIPFLKEKFYQGDIEKTGDIKNRGMGIGLSLVEKIIESHNWSSEIKSEVGKGFSFKIKF